MSKALLRYIRLSPTKARLIAREIQGMNAELAIASLEFTPNKAAHIISKVVASAVANGGFEAQNVYIASCRVDAGPVLRRFMPRAKGRATPIRKPTSHILIEISDKLVQKDTKKTSTSSKKQTIKEEKSPKKISKKEVTQTSKKTKGEDK